MSLRSLRFWFGPWVAGGVVVAVIAAGCSSSSNSSGPGASDAGANEGGLRKLLDDAAAGGGDDGGGGDGGGAFDKTTGQACTTDKDCASPNGPGVNRCSNAFSQTFSGVDLQFWSTPVCILPPTGPNCDPAPAGTQPGLVHFCDGPDDPSSPGLCVPNDMANPQPMQGLCYPKCTMPLDGSKPSTCVGSNVCQPAGVMGVASGSPTTLIGYCQSLCQTDSDCSALGAGYGCQTDIGNCTLKKVVRTKAIGASCTVATDGGADDTTAGACDCLAGSSGAGFCSSLCVVGGAPCPNGWVCDAGQTAMTFPGATLTKQTKGIPGLCFPPCAATDAGSAATTTEGDAAVDGASASPPDGGTPPDAGAQGQCPGSWSCMSTTLAGPNCMP